MSKIISKELLGGILGIKIDSVEHIEENLIAYSFMSENPNWKYCSDCEDPYEEKYLQDYKTINIYEFMAKAKEWAYKYGQEMASYRIGDTEPSKWRCLFGFDIKICKSNMGFYAETEYMAVFKACQWILDNKVKT